MKSLQNPFVLAVSLSVLFLLPAYGKTIDQDGCGYFEKEEARQCFRHSEKWRKWSGFGEGNDVLVATYKNQCGHRVYVHVEGMKKEKPYDFSSGFDGAAFSIPNGESYTRVFYDSTGNVIYSVVVSEKSMKDWVCYGRYGGKEEDMHKEAIQKWGTPSGWNQSSQVP